MTKKERQAHSNFMDAMDNIGKSLDAAEASIKSMIAYSSNPDEDAAFDAQTQLDSIEFHRVEAKNQADFIVNMLVK